MFTAKLIQGNECYKIVGACFEVYRDKGCGFLEAVFHECLAIELATQHIPFECQKVLRLAYKGVPLQQTYVADFVCYGIIIVELKSVSRLSVSICVHPWFNWFGVLVAALAASGV